MSDAVTLVTQADFARLMGVSRKSVTSWKARGWLVLEDGQVDVEASRAVLRQHRVTPPGIDAPAPEPAVADIDEDEEHEDQADIDALAARILEDTGVPWTRDQAKQVKENYLALRQRLAYDLECKAVVAVDKVAAMVGADYAQVRTRVLSIPAERAPELHRCKSVEELRDRLEAILVEALEALSQADLADAA